MVDIVFPGDTNHHGTLFGGIGLAHMDKVAFIVASRFARIDFVTASCERIDFEAPARLGEIVELTGRVIRAGTRSLAAQVELVAEAPLTGARRRCGRGVFNMVAVPAAAAPAWRMPTLDDRQPAPPPELRMVGLVFPEHTSHYGSLYGGNALTAMAKAAFVAATRHCRKPVVLASARHVDLEGQVRSGELIEAIPRIAAVGRSSLTVYVALWAEDLRTGDRRLCGTGTYVMVAVTAEHRPVALDWQPPLADAAVPVR